MQLELSQLNKVYFTISDIMAEKQQDIGKKKFEMNNPRPTDALMLFTGASSICYQENEKPFYIPQGALVYVPRFSKYVWEDSPVTEDNRLEKLLFEFTLNYVATTNGKDNEIVLSSLPSERISFGNKICIISTEYTSLYKKCFIKLIETFEEKQTSILSPFIEAYNFFDILSRKSSVVSTSSKDLMIIHKGILYMEENLCPKKTISEIAEMCGVSVGHFERLFKIYAGVSPTEYINANKILYIKKLLQDRTLSLSEIAEKMGYCDSGYLCRFFLKKTGMTTKEYRNLYFSFEAVKT